MEEPAAGGLPQWTGVYAAFDDVALAALANRGLVRRGRAEVATGRVRPVRIGDDAVVAAAGNPAVEVVLPPGGPALARCPCPVAGVCIHVVAACLWLRGAAEALPDGAGPDGASSAGAGPHGGRAGSAGEERTGAPPAGAGPHGGPRAEDANGPRAEGPGAAEGADAAGAAADGPVDALLAEVLSWQPAAVEKDLGAPAARRVAAALAGIGTGDLAEGLELGGAPGRLVATWPGAPEIVIVAGLGPRGMVVSGRHSRVARAAWCLQAVVRIFAASSRDWPWPQGSARLSDGQRDVLEAAAGTVEGVVSAGISRAGARSARELERLAQAARLEEMPRPSRLLASAAGTLGAVARREDAVDEARALGSLAAAWSLARAVLAAPDAPDPVLLGRAGTRQAEPGLLVPLSAVWWRTPSGSRGVTARFWDADHHRLESVTTGRAAGADPGFQCSEGAVLLWNTSIGALLSGPLRLKGATRRADGALAPSSRTTAVSRGDFDGVDLPGLAAELDALQSGPGAAGFEAPAPRVRLIPVAGDGLGRMDLDEVHQEYVWPVSDVDGRTHLLRLDPVGAEPRFVASLLARNLPVVALTVEAGRPTGVFVHSDGALKLFAPSLSSVLADSYRFFRRLSERLEGLRARAVAVAPGRELGPVEALCADAREALADLAASGAPAPEGMTAHVLTTRARAADQMQLTTLAAALEEVIARPGPAAVLRACAVVDRVRALAA